MFYFDLWGYFTEYSQSRVRKTLSRIIFIVHLVFLLFIISFTIYKNLFDESFKTRMTLANDAMKTYTSLLSYLLIIIESFGSRKSQHKYWTTVSKIQQLQNNPEIKLRAFTLFCALNIFWTFFTGGSFIYQHYVAEWEYLAFVTISLMQTQMYQHRIHFYTLYLNILREHLGYVLRELHSASYRCRNNTDLRMFRNYYVLIVESISCINYIFGWSNAINILYSFHMLLSQLNWFVELAPKSPIITGIGKKFGNHLIQIHFNWCNNCNYCMNNTSLRMLHICISLHFCVAIYDRMALSTFGENIFHTFFSI